MTPLQTWFEAQTAPTPEAMLAGDGCHPDEARALSDYLNNYISAEETAKRITTPILNETNPPEELYRLWCLLSDDMAELTTNDRHKIVDVLSHIESLPSCFWHPMGRSPGIRQHVVLCEQTALTRPDSWERSVGSFGREEIDEPRRSFAAVGHAEAEMFLWGVVSAGWGYEVLNLACSGRKGVDVFVSEILLGLIPRARSSKKRRSDRKIPS